MRAGTKRNPAIWANSVDGQWEGKRPILSPEESLAAARKLWRHAVGKAWKGEWKLTSGRRSTRPIRGVFYVNPDEPGERGLREIIHSISHVAHARLHPKDAPHSIAQVRLEARLTKFAIARRWHEGSLAKLEPPSAPPEPPKPTLKERREARRLAALARAKHRLKLAQAAVERLEGKPKRRKARAKPRVVKRPQFMAQAKKLAAAHGITIERDDMGSGPGWWVFGPAGIYGDRDGFGEDEGFRADPCEGSHFCGSPQETLHTVQEYLDDMKGVAR